MKNKITNGEAHYLMNCLENLQKEDLKEGAKYTIADVRELISQLLEERNTLEDINEEICVALERTNRAYSKILDEDRFDDGINDVGSL